MTVKLGLIGIVTADLAASLAFYRTLGLPIPEGLDGEPHVEIEVSPGVRLAWDTIATIRSFDPSYEPGSGGHRIALAFDAGSPDGVDAAYARMIAAGHAGHAEPWDAFWGQRYATLLDPDGNGVDLYASLDPAG